jgi:hypothetical protein
VLEQKMAVQRKNQIYLQQAVSRQKTADDQNDLWVEQASKFMMFLGNLSKKNFEDIKALRLAIMTIIEKFAPKNDKYKGL